MPRSLSSRLLIVLTIWLLVALVITGLFLSASFRRNAEQNFQGVLLANAYNLMGEIVLNDNGQLVGSPNLGDPRFLKPLSGWYWSVSLADDAERPILHSLSITGENIAIKDTLSLPFSDQFRRTYQFEELYGAHTQRLEAQLYLGDSESLYQVLVAGNRNELEQSVSAFNVTLLRFFLLFGIGTIFATYFAVRFGLKPLEQAASSLHDIREGRAEKLEGRLPSEIAPLAQEINALIETNRSVTERARTQVGNLAHALKTPLAVIFNEVRRPSSNTNARVEEQAETMQLQVNNYLDRARIAAQRGSILSKTEINPVIDRIVRVMGKLFPKVHFSYSHEVKEIIFRGEEHDLEEVLGNLLENAGRFAKSRVDVTAKTLTNTARPQFEIRVDDDGPGLTKTQRMTAVERGKRLDETTPGSGLGLSIVRDIAAEYDGTFTLEENEAGGLRAVVVLPAVVSG